jgi:hypothetical protein
MTTLETPTRLSFRGVDFPFDVVADVPEIAAVAAAACRDLTEPDGTATAEATMTYRLSPGEAPGTVDLWAGQEPVTRGSESWHAVAMLLWHVNQRVAASASRTHTVVHAAAAVRDGKAVLLAAPMESGKTTTVTGLLRAGFDYLTDEAAAIHPGDLHIEPFPKGLSIDAGSWPVLHDLAPLDTTSMPHQWVVPVSAMGAPAGGIARRAPIDAIVFPRFEKGAITRLEPCSRGEGVLLLAQSTFHFLDDPERHLRTLADVVRRARTCARLTIGSLDDAVAAVCSLMDDA